MPFAITLTQLEDTIEAWNAAARYANKKATEGSKDKNAFYQKKKEEKKKVHESSEFMQNRLQHAIKQVPSISYMHPFHRTLLECSTNHNLFKQSIGRIQATKDLISKWEKFALEQIDRIRNEKGSDLGIPRKKFWGKTKSALEKLEKFRKTYNNGVRVLQSLPQLDFNQKIIVIAGFPNVGKSTLLKRWTHSAPKIAPYPFTTKGIMVGKMTVKYQLIQWLDTPGLLDRLQKERNPIEKKAIAALELVADGVVFVIDPTMESGFPLDSQKRLLESLQEKIKRPFKLVLNKLDKTSEEQLVETKKWFGNEFIESGEGTKWENNGIEEIVEWVQTLKKTNQ